MACKDLFELLRDAIQEKEDTERDEALLSLAEGALLSPAVKKSPAKESIRDTFTKGIELFSIQKALQFGIEFGDIINITRLGRKDNPEAIH